MQRHAAANLNERAFMTQGTVLTGLTGSITLPGGIDFKVSEGDLVEQFVEKDAEGFADGGFQYGVICGKGLKGTVKGYITANQFGIGDPNVTAFEGVPFLFTAATGYTYSGNCNITRLGQAIKVGEVQAASMDFSSQGPYTATATQS